MGLSNIEVPLWNGLDEGLKCCGKQRLFVNKFAGRIQLQIREGEHVIDIEFDKDDFVRACDAIREY